MMYDTSSGVLSLCGSCSPHIFLFYFRGCFAIKNNNSKELLINEAILKANGFTASKTVRVVGPDGEQLGLIEAETALENAYDKGLDLVLISPSAEPPVCRIMDYGKFRFERAKKEKEAKKKQQVIEVKEVQLSCRIDTHDFNTKANHAKRFLSEGNSYKFLLIFERNKSKYYLNICFLIYY